MNKKAGDTKANVLIQVLFTVLMILVVLAALGYGAFCAYALTKKHDAMTVTYDNDGNETTYYVMVDPDTGVQYVVNDKGGMCPRLRTDGTVFGTGQKGSR